jgi:hypothetical protein
MSRHNVVTTQAQAKLWMSAASTFYCAARHPVPVLFFYL